MRHAALFAAFAWTISMTRPGDIAANRNTVLEATVKDEKGMPVKDASVEMTVTMLDMDHGETKREAKQKAPGAYSADAQFAMAGNWNVKVKVQKGGESAVKDFKIEVKH